jgi:pyroglutamyl-peptidase
MVLLSEPLSQPVVLLTGFDPFAGDRRNASWAAASILHGRVINGHRVIARQLPTTFSGAAPALMEALDRFRPALVLCVGQAAGRAAIGVERVAVNWVDARIADNAGDQPADCAAIAGAPTAYFCTVPVKAIVAALCADAIPADVSMSAGTFVCNHVFFALMHRLATNPPQRGARGGFLHVPSLPEQGQPALALERTVAGLKLAITACLTQGDDIRRPGGTLH